MASQQLPRNGLPPVDVRLNDVLVEPSPDGRRIRVHVTITPFLQPPNLEASVHDAEGTEIASASIIEPAHSKLVFTLHLRTTRFLGQYTLITRLYYPDGDVDQRKTFFELGDTLKGEG